MSTTTLPNGVTTTYAYNNAHRLTGLTQATTQTLGQYTYTLDNVGNRAAVTETIRQPGGTVSTPDVIFADGFESNSLGGWTSSTTGSGRLSPTAKIVLSSMAMSLLRRIVPASSRVRMSRFLRRVRGMRRIIYQSQ